MLKISDQLEALLEPQERFADLSAVAFRRHGRNLVDLSYANAYDGPDDTVRSALQSAILENRELGFQYTPYGGKTTTRRLIASKLREEYGLPFQFSDVILTPGAMAALNMAFRTVFPPDAEVLVIVPCWLDYPLYLTNLGLSVRFVTMTPTKHLDLDAIENALSERSGGIVFSHPCCPTGVMYSNSEIQELANLLKWGEKRFRRPLFLISDEVHRHVNWSRSEFTSPLLDYPRSLSIYSFGKVLLMQGQRIGYVAVSPLMPDREHVDKMLERAARIMGFCTPTTLMQRAICRLVDYKPPLESIVSKQLEIRSALKAYGYDVCDGEATFFVYVKSPLPDDIQFAERLAREGVLVLPSMLFHEKGYFRISATARADAVRRGLPIFERMLV